MEEKFVCASSLSSNEFIAGRPTSNTRIAISAERWTRLPAASHISSQASIMRAAHLASSPRKDRNATVAHVLAFDPIQDWAASLTDYRHRRCKPAHRRRVRLLYQLAAERIGRYGSG